MNYESVCVSYDLHVKYTLRHLIEARSTYIFNNKLYRFIKRRSIYRWNNKLHNSFQARSIYRWSLKLLMIPRSLYGLSHYSVNYLMKSTRNDLSGFVFMTQYYDKFNGSCSVLQFTFGYNMQL